ncbi:Hypothetical protein A7982_05785 [Minicystis rosea]|nr:Hypothetical protein A7982_05785 [Minicystis rosea]
MLHACVFGSAPSMDGDHQKSSSSSNAGSSTSSGSVPP